MENRQLIYNENHQVWQEKLTPVPIPSMGELLIKVLASSLNPIDLKRKNQTPLPVGYDGTGIIAALGEKVTNFKVGQAVYYAGTTTRAGSFADYQVVAAEIVAPVPKTVSLTDSAGLPLVSLTAFELLFEKFNFIPARNANLGKKLLIINGAGGVGSMMSQLAKWAGIEVAATASPKHFDWLRANGVTQPLDYHSTGSTPRLNQLFENQFDAIAVLHQIVPYFPIAIQLVRPFGHIGTIVSLDQPIDLNQLKDKAISFDWESMFAKTINNFRTVSQGEILTTISQLVDTQQIQPITTMIYDSFDAETLAAASNQLISGHLNGKIVLRHT